MIVLTAQQAANLLWKDQFSDSVLRPRRLSDGKYALPESALTDPRHARWRSLLKQGTIVPAGSLTFDAPADGQQFSLNVDGKEMYLQLGDQEYFGYPAPRLFDMPAENVYRFESHYNKQPSTDRQHGRRRVELIQEHSTGWTSGDTLWASWSTVLNDQRDGFVAEAGTLIYQWHADYDSPNLGPVFWIVLHGGKLQFCSRSDVDGAVQHTHYEEDFTPASGAPTNFVVSGLLGNPGHLNVWVNGEQIADVDIPIGYYTEPYPFLAFPQVGIYMNNTRTVDVLYHANIEYGTADLSARINEPLTVNTPAEGWGPGALYPQPEALHPDTGLYPATNLFPL